MLTWELFDEVGSGLPVSRSEASGIWRKEQAIYRWAATRHGVYLPVTKETRPDPQSGSIPDRDVTTPSGKKLTLMSPPAVMQQIFAMDDGEPAACRGRMTQLRPVDPANTPDNWETAGVGGVAARAPEDSSWRRSAARAICG